MKISAIDIGSNSVRLATCEGGKTLYKRLKTTRLGAGLADCGRLSAEAIERTAAAVAEFAAQACNDGADKLYAFATAAVRSAVNGGDFVKRVKEICGLNVEVLSGETEAQCGLIGAVGLGDGGIIDVGGASTEFTVRCGGKIIYSKSVDIGTVRLYDAAERDRQKLLGIIGGKLKDFGNFDASVYKIYAIGGTASRLAAIKHNLKVYNPEVINGTVLSVEETQSIAEMLLAMPVDRIRAQTICTASADVVGGGCLLTAQVMRHFNLPCVTVSDGDNLEGYIKMKEGGL